MLNLVPSRTNSDGSTVWVIRAKRLPGNEFIKRTFSELTGQEIEIRERNDDRHSMVVTLPADISEIVRARFARTLTLEVMKEV